MTKRLISLKNNSYYLSFKGCCWRNQTKIFKIDMHVLKFSLNNSIRFLNTQEYIWTDNFRKYLRVKILFVVKSKATEIQIKNNNYFNNVLMQFQIVNEFIFRVGFKLFKYRTHVWVCKFSVSCREENAPARLFDL